MTSRARRSRWPAAAVCTALTIGLAGCSAESSTTTPSSPTPTAPAADPWVGETLEGEPVTIVDGDGPPSFQDGVPTAIYFIDEAAAGGCDALQLEYQWWEGQIDDTEQGTWASAYADYALDRRAELGCP